MASIRPSVLKCVVAHGTGFIEKIRGVSNLSQYSWCLQNIKQRGPDLFTQQYLSPKTKSESYLKSMETEEKLRIATTLGLEVTESEVLENDTRGYDSSTYQLLYEEDEQFEKGFIPEFKKEETKERGKSMKVDRMIKKHNKESEKENQKIVGTKNRPIDQDKLVKYLHKEKAKSAIESASTQMISVGDAISVMLDCNRQKELEAAGIAPNKNINKNHQKVKEKREEDTSPIFKYLAKR